MCLYCNKRTHRRNIFVSIGMRLAMRPSAWTYGISFCNSLKLYNFIGKCNSKPFNPFQKINIFAVIKCALKTQQNHLNHSKQWNNDYKITLTGHGQKTRRLLKRTKKRHTVQLISYVCTHSATIPLDVMRALRRSTAMKLNRGGLQPASSHVASGLVRFGWSRHTSHTRRAPHARPRFEAMKRRCDGVCVCAMCVCACLQLRVDAQQYNELSAWSNAYIK